MGHGDHSGVLYMATSQSLVRCNDVVFIQDMSMTRSDTKKYWYVPQLPSTSRRASPSSSSSMLLFQNLYNLRLFESLVSCSLATEKTCFRSARWRDDLSAVGELDAHELSATNDNSLPRRRRLFLLGGSREPVAVDARDCMRGSRTVDITRSNAWFDGVRARSVRKGAISASMGARGGRSSPFSEFQARTLSSSSR